MFVMKIITLDFEFNRVTHPNVNLVCCVTNQYDKDTLLETKRFWLHNDPLEQGELKLYLENHSDHVMVAYAVTAEARSFISLGLDGLKFDWVDLFLEYRQITNHCDDYMYGMQLVGGTEVMTKRPPPKWQRTEGDAKGFKPKHSLAEARYKLLGTITDTKHKDEMRDLIISDPETFTPEEQGFILDYCESDTYDLKMMYDELIHIYKETFDMPFDYVFPIMKERAQYSVLTAEMEVIGYPINHKKTRNLTDAIPSILETIQREINDLFPEIKPFVYKKAERKFSMSSKALQVWIVANMDTSRWTKTDGYKTVLKKLLKEARDKKGKKLSLEEMDAIEASIDVTPYLSLSLDAWAKFFHFRHDFPKDNFGAQMLRYLKTKQALSGFAETKLGSFWDSVGPDGRVRPYFNHFGSQTSRSQPASKGFLFLKTAWMRVLCEPEEGEILGSVDYGSQEYLIAALHAEDEAMIDSYFSDDVYLAFAKLSGMVPSNATKDSHPEERQLAKSCVLSMSFLQTAFGLAEKLSEDLGKEVTEEEAQEYIDSFYEVFNDLKKSQDATQKLYKRQGYLELPCGWRLMGDQDNFRSVTNFVIQGRGSSIMRKAVAIARSKGLKVVKTLHDAIYISFTPDNKYIEMDLLMDSMKEAMAFYFEDPYLKEKAYNVKLDPYMWGPSLAPYTETIKKNGETAYEPTLYHTPSGREVYGSNIYIDDRATKEYNQFSKHLENTTEELL